jgi:hypothetical protein
MFGKTITKLRNSSVHAGKEVKASITFLIKTILSLDINSAKDIPMMHLAESIIVFENEASPRETTAIVIPVRAAAKEEFTPFGLIVCGAILFTILGVPFWVHFCQ